MSSESRNYLTRYKKYSTDLRRYYQMPAVQTSLSVVLSIFIVAFFIIFALRPTLVTITGLNKTIAQSEDTLKKLTTKSAALQSISVSWEKIQPMEKYLNNSIPVDGVRYRQLATTLEIIAYESGVTLSSQSTGGALTFSTIIDPYIGPDRNVVSTPFSLTVIGSYPAVNTFVTKLLAIDRLISIESLSYVQDTKKSDSEAHISTTITGNVHYAANPQMINTFFGKRSSESLPAATEEVAP